MSTRLANNRPIPPKRQKRVGGWEGKEKDLQSLVENYLTLKGVGFFHIPEHLQRWLRTQAPAHIARFASIAFKGVPDLVCFRDDGTGFGSSLLIELKRKGGVLSQGQRAWHKGKKVFVCYDFDEARNVIDRWLDDV
jgi:hypothetical protein